MNEQEAREQAERIASAHDLSPANKRLLASSIANALLAASKPPPGHIIDENGVRKVLGTLPLTADGCVAIPFISVVYHPEHPSRSLDVDVCNDEVIGQVSVPSSDGEFVEWHEYAIGDCYSTREAAEAAREAKP